MSRIIRGSPFGSAKWRSILTWQFFLYLLLSHQIFIGLKNRWLLQSGDAAGYVDILSPDSGMRTFRFAYGFSTMRMFELIRIGPEKIQEVGFIDPYQLVPFYQAHPYFIGYIFRLVRIGNLPIEVFPLAALAMSYALGLVALISYGLKQQIKSYTSLLLISIILTSPIFIFSILGQPYIDRLSFGPFIIIFLKLINPKSLSRRDWILVLSSILFCILLSERSSLMVGVLVILLFLLRKKAGDSLSRYGKVVLMTAFVGIIWYFFWSSAISRNRDIANNTSFSQVLISAKSILFGDRHELALAFVFTLAPFLIAIFFRSKFFVILPIFILPNILVSIGGAELTGYYTHYHAMYLPIAAAVLYISATHFSNSNKTSGGRTRLTLTLLFALSLNFFQYTDGHISGVNAKVHVGQIMDGLGLTPTEIKVSRKAREMELTKIFRLINQPNSSVSLPEGLMPLSLSTGITKMSYFPVGIGNSEYLIVPFTNETLNTVEFSIFGLVPEEDRKKWSEQIMQSINKSYVVIGTYSGTFGYIQVYKKL